MRRIIPREVVPLLLLVGALSGCVGLNEPADEPTDDGLVERTCSLGVPEAIPPGAYAYRVGEFDWDRNAPFLSHRLNETIDEPRPTDLQGPCELVEPDAEWLLSLYARDENASSTETFPNLHNFFFVIEVDSDEVPLRIWGKPYGYERWPPTG